MKEREEKLRKEVEIEEKRALLRWTTEYIEKNSERWEKEALVREQEQKRKLQEWEKKSRFEKIHFLKEKLRLERDGNKDSQVKEKPQSPEKTWNIWREKKPQVEEKKTFPQVTQEKEE